MKIFRVIMGILLTVLLAATVVAGQVVSLADEATKNKNASRIFDTVSVGDLVSLDAAGETAFKQLVTAIQGVSENINEETAMQILNSDSMVSVYRDTATRLSKYLHEESSNRQETDELAALVAGALQTVKLEGVTLTDEEKTALETVASEGVTAYVDSLYAKIDKLRDFNLFKLDQFSIFGNARILAAVVGLGILVVLSIVCWSVGRGLIITGLIMILASAPFVIVGLGKQEIIPFKFGKAGEMARGLFDSLSLPIMLWSLVVVAVGFIFLIIGISARLGSRTEDDE